MILSTSAIAVLLLQRLAQLIEQAGVLDRDNRLGGEVFDQLPATDVSGSPLQASILAPYCFFGRRLGSQIWFLIHRYKSRQPNRRHSKRNSFAIVANTGAQLSGRICLNKRTVGYQGLSSRSSIQGQ